ncbi:site-specific DNA-methyltransferase [Paenibacillus tarimensis]|uniref:site-specific DNA-methyltransferase n=1 Tax=Paenibacillus tarimensis TaxID=416012 RepID=UPI001F193F23|nr:site-specific DNA-methyltransferase [Paenibacillus tarimensis]MCF2945447.1 site-specific DNA-methyltransferase [Paenibacillus tarimensis]
MFHNKFFKALNISSDIELKQFAKETQINISKLKYYNQYGIIPHKKDMSRLLEQLNISELEFKLRMGTFDNQVLKAIQENAREIEDLIKHDIRNEAQDESKLRLTLQTEYGHLYQGDCLSLMDTMEDESVDLIFADPPFNLNKEYESGMNDNISNQQYQEWTEKWVLKCVDLLKEGGSLFIWNLPKWNTFTANILDKYLILKHWIAVDIKFGLPLKNRLYPSHYSLLYYTKGEKPNTFNEQRLPLDICRKCGGDIRDYGGYKDKLNQKGINVTDVWFDIPPVRHSKYKTRNSNELSMKVLDRVISLATNEGDLVFDPFGGSGTTYIVSEILKRKWIGVEIGPTEGIIERFKDINIQKDYIEKLHKNKNTLFTEEMRKIRIKNGHWLPETLTKKSTKKQVENQVTFDV